MDSSPWRAERKICFSIFKITINFCNMTAISEDIEDASKRAGKSGQKSFSALENENDNVEVGERERGIRVDKCHKCDGKNFLAPR